MIAYFVVVVVVSLICTVEIAVQAFARRGGTAKDEKVACVEGIRSLVRAVDRARSEAHGTSRVEADAVAYYRSALQPAWSWRGAVRRACHGDNERLQTLDAVVYLGFAEEHAVRRNAVELASFRRRASDLLSKHITPGPASGDAPAPSR